MLKNSKNAQIIFISANFVAGVIFPLRNAKMIVEMSGASTKISNPEVKMPKNNELFLFLKSY